MTKFGVAQPVRRVEDPRLLLGHGRYTDDIALADEAHRRRAAQPACCGQDPVDRHRGGKARCPACSASTPAPTSRPMASAEPCAIPLKNRDGTTARRRAAPRAGGRRRPPRRRPGRVHRRRNPPGRAGRRRGDHHRLRHPAERAPTSPPPWNRASRRSGRTCQKQYLLRLGDRRQGARPTSCSPRPQHVTRLTVVNNRIVVNSMEARAAIADYDAGSHRWTLTTNTQGGWGIKDMLAEVVFKVPAESFRVVTPDVGGGFGMKLFLYAEHAMVCYAARKLGRAGEMDQRALRGLPVRHAWPRQHHPGRDRARQGRHLPGDAHPQRRQHGRLSQQLRPVHPDRRRHQGAGQRLWLPGDPRQRARRVHQHRRRWTPTAAPGGRRATTWSSG